MKNPKQKLKNILLLVTVLFAFSCSEELFENRVHHHDEDKNEISFKQFKNETGINKFDYLKKAGISKSTDFQARTIESEFITDTIGIKKYVNPTNNKTTYSFKIYPLSEDLNAKEYYNLVYEKVGTEWNEIIFFNTEKANPTDARTLESSEMVYNRISGREGFSEVITYSFHCTGCTGPCDMCNKCVSTHVSYIYTGIQDSGSSNNGIPTGTGNNNNGNSGGGSDEYSGIFIPNSYDGDVDLNNPDFIFAGQVVAYTSSLPPNLKDVMSNNFWLFYDIKEFFKNNGGLTRANKDAVVYALSNIQAIFTTLSQNSNDLTTVQINQTKQSAFVFLLQHGAWLSGQSATTQQSILQNLTSLEKIEKMDELADYIILNPSVLWNDLMNNRTAFDTSTGDLDNNSDDGFDTTTYSYFNPAQNWSNIPSVIPINKFVGWNRSAHPNWQCMEYSKEQLRVMGYKISNYGATGQTFQIYTTQNGVNNTALTNGLNYLKYALSNNIPVIVGVDNHSGSPNPETDNTTDHFIVIVGMGQDSNGKYFQFYDNASGDPTQGANISNKLYYNSTTGIISGSSMTSYAINNGLNPYKITMIRKSKSL